MTVLLDLISIFSKSLSTVLRWQSGSQSELKNQLTLRLVMVHFIKYAVPINEYIQEKHKLVVDAKKR